MRFLVVGIVIAVIFWVVSIVDCAVQPETRHRGVAKGGWLAIVILLPVIGGVLWFAVGRITKHAPLAPIAPDDNPAFLSSIGSISDQNERIRRLEEELARLDDDTPPATGADSSSNGDDDPSQRGPAGATN